MDIQIKVEPLEDYIDIHGGEYTESETIVHVDEKLTSRQQRRMVIHGVIDQLMFIFPHETVDLMTDTICDALDELNEELAVK